MLSCIVLCVLVSAPISFLFFFNDTATTEIYTLSLHDALPISDCYLGLGVYDYGLARAGAFARFFARLIGLGGGNAERGIRYIDRKSTRLNSSHLVISYAVFCLKKKKHNQTDDVALDEQHRPQH